VSLRLRFDLNVRGRLHGWIYYRCPKRRAARDLGSVCVNVFCRALCCIVWAGLEVICCVWLYGYRRVFVLVGMTDIKVMRVFNVEI
jgi:hypothetical protein